MGTLLQVNMVVHSKTPSAGKYPMHTTSLPGVHLDRNSGETIQIGGFGTRIRVPAALTNGSTTLVEHTLAPGLMGAPMHRHTREDEVSYVQEGVLSVQLGDRVLTAGPGEIVVKPRGEFHAFWNAGEEPLRFLEVIAPGGFESYFAELARIVPACGPPDMDEIGALGERFGVEFDFASIPVLMARHGVRLG
jgi:mannose-6-phosphate isomerase-like protein (cupin superfamily)